MENLIKKLYTMFKLFLRDNYTLLEMFLFILPDTLFTGDISTGNIMTSIMTIYTSLNIIKTDQHHILDSEQSKERIGFALTLIFISVNQTFWVKKELYT